MANKLTSGDISEITRQSDVISKPLRDNFTNLKNKTNEIIDEIAAISIGTTNAETTAARPYHTDLKERLDNKNITPSGGVVTVNGGDTSKVDITEFIATIEGIDVKIAATTSAAISASAAGNHRVDVVVGNTSNAFVIVTGAESLKASADPIFPSISSTQIPLAALYVDDTASVNLTNNIYAMKIEQNDLPNYYIKQATTLNQGRYEFNNLIVDAATTIDCTATGGYTLLQRQNIFIKCAGNFYNTSSGDITITSPHVLNNDGDNGSAASAASGGAGGSSGFKTMTTWLRNFSTGQGSNGAGGDGNDASDQSRGGGGGGGGASIIAAGGNGGGGATSGGGASSGDGSAGTALNVNGVFFVMTANLMNISGNIDLSGNDGPDGGDATRTQGAGGGGGAGGGAGGHVALIAKDDITINAGATVDASGGDGGNGGDSTSGSKNNAGGGGGGGGAGGMLLIRSKTYTNNGTVQANAGGAGTGGSASGGSGANNAGSNGNAGSAGVVDQNLYTDLSTTLADNIFPLNFYGEL
jgi:hypothetical protein